MLLIGQFDSPFVRRVAVALAHHEIPFEHWPWSTFGDADRIAKYNPLRRVPTLVLDDGEVLVDSGAILDHLDEVVGEARAMLPRSGPRRRDGLRVCGLGTGLADKAVSLFYERRLHGEHASAAWVTRCEKQIGEVLAVLERDRAARDTEWWLGGSLSHADTTVACALRFLREVHPHLLDAALPALAAHAARCEALPEFQKHQQPFTSSA